MVLRAFNCLSFWGPLVGLVIGFLLFLVVIIAVLFMFFNIEGPKPGPQEVFENQLQAVDESRWEDAQVLLDPLSCGSLATEDIKAAQQALSASGETFQTAFQVTEVWLEEGGDRAILGLEVPAGLPSVQPLSKIDGEWLLTC